MRIAKWLLFTSCALLLAVGAGTLWALESGGTAFLYTRMSNGEERRTTVWYAEDGGALWIEAATPERGFLDDVRRSPEVKLARDGHVAKLRARVADTPEAHARIRSLLRAKYGARDWYVSWLQDTSRSVAVELTR